MGTVLVVMIGLWLLIVSPSVFVCGPSLRFQRGRFDSSWMRVFIDVAIANDV